MFERFDDDARKVFPLATEHARRLGQPHLGTEHILLGLLGDGDTRASRVLMSLRIDPHAVTTEIERVVEQGTSTVGSEHHLPFTEAAKRVLVLTMRESQQLGQDYIGPEHLLLGLITEGDGPAARVLPTHGADLDRVRQQVLHTLEGQSVGGSTVATNTRVQAQPSSAPSGDLAARLDILERKLDETLDRLDGIEKRLPPR